MNNLKKDNINYFTFSNNTEIHSLTEVLENSIFIFDEIICDKQNIIKEYFSMGRHRNVDCFYIGRTYLKIPKILIRDNTKI